MDEAKPQYRLTAQVIVDGQYEIRVPINYEVWRDGVYERLIAEFTGQEPWPAPSIDTESPFEHRQNHLKRVTHFALWVGRTGYRLADKAIPDVVVKTSFVLPSGTTTTLWLPASVLLDASKLKSLADLGADVNSNNAAHVVAYVAALRGKNRDLPMANVARRVGYYNLEDAPSWLIGSQWIGDPDLVEVDDQGHTPLMRAYSPARVQNEDDAYLEWRAFVDGYLFDDQGGPFTRWLFAQSFLAPISNIIGQRGMIAHLYGESGSGKSAVSSLAMTCWGNPNNGALFQGLNKTQNAILEMFETQVSDAPILLDELQVTDARFNKAQLIYSLVLGQGKARVDSHGVRLGSADAKFTAVVQMTGEQPLIDQDLGGQTNRVIEIEVSKSILPDNDRVRAIYKFIRERRLWGFAGPKFLRTIRNRMQTQEQRDAFASRYADVKDGLSTCIDHIGSLDMLSAVAYAEYLMLRFLFIDSGDAAADATESMNTALADARWIYEQAVEPQRRDQSRPLWQRALDVLREHVTANPSAYPNLNTPEGQTAAERGSNARGFAGFISHSEMIYLPAAFDRICVEAFGISGKRIASDLCANAVAVGAGKYKRVERSRLPWLPPGRYIVIPRDVLLEKREPMRVNVQALADWNPEAEY